MILVDWLKLYKYQLAYFVDVYNGIATIAFISRWRFEVDNDGQQLILEFVMACNLALFELG